MRRQSIRRIDWHLFSSRSVTDARRPNQTPMTCQFLRFRTSVDEPCRQPRTLLDQVTHRPMYPAWIRRQQLREAISVGPQRWPTGFPPGARNDPRAIPISEMEPDLSPYPAPGPSPPTGPDRPPSHPRQAPTHRTPTRPTRPAAPIAHRPRWSPPRRPRHRPATPIGSPSPVGRGTSDTV